MRASWEASLSGFWVGCTHSMCAARSPVRAELHLSNNTTHSTNHSRWGVNDKRQAGALPAGIAFQVRPVEGGARRGPTIIHFRALRQGREVPRVVAIPVTVLVSSVGSAPPCQSFASGTSLAPAPPPHPLRDANGFHQIQLSEKSISLR